MRGVHWPHGYLRSAPLDGFAHRPVRHDRRGGHRRAGAAILQSYAHHRADLVIDRKARNDLVSQADREAEAAIIQELRARTPQFGIVAEETGGQAQGSATWYIDPLDGTTNFLHDIPTTRFPSH